MNKVLLKDLCFENSCGIYGIPASAEEFNPSKTRYLRITDISEDGKLLNSDKKSVSDENIEKYILKEGDIVFARTGNSTGKTYYHEDKNGVLAYAGFLIKYSLDPKKINPKYLRYFTISKYYNEWVDNLSLGSTRGNINANTFKTCPILLPERSQQDLLVKVLSDLDAKIELNNKINRELEAMAKTLYDYWFVQFGFPNEQGKPYKSSGGKMVFNEELKREIPEGWEVKKFGDYAKVKSGFAFKSTWWQDTGVPVLKIKDILEDYTLNQDDFSFVDENKIVIAKNYESKAGNVVIAMTGATIGKFAIIPYTDKPILINQRVGLYDLANKPFEKVPFLVNSMKQDFFRLKVYQMAGGAAQPNISGEQLDAFPLIFPNNNLIADYNNKMISIYKRIANTIKENQQLTALRDWLLPMLMNGQVTVGEAEEKLSMAAEPQAEYEKN